MSCDVDRNIVRRCCDTESSRFCNHSNLEPGIAKCCEYCDSRLIRARYMSAILRMSALSHYWSDQVFDTKFYVELFPELKAKSWSVRVFTDGIVISAKWIARHTIGVESLWYPEKTLKICYTNDPPGAPGSCHNEMNNRMNRTDKRAIDKRSPINRKTKRKFNGR